MLWARTGRGAARGSARSVPPRLRPGGGVYRAAAGYSVRFLSREAAKCILEIRPGSGWNACSGVRVASSFFSGKGRAYRRSYPTVVSGPTVQAVQALLLLRPVASVPSAVFHRPQLLPPVCARLPGCARRAWLPAAGAHRARRAGRLGCHRPARRSGDRLRGRLRCSPGRLRRRLRRICGRLCSYRRRRCPRPAVPDPLGGGSQSRHHGGSCSRRRRRHRRRRHRR
jgi:hypothetical protein